MFLNKITKIQFLKEVNRTSPHSKITSIMALSKNKYSDILRNEELFNEKCKRNFFIAWISRHVKLLKNISYLLAVTQNIIILLFSTEFTLRDFGSKVKDFFSFLKKYNFI